MKKYIKYIVIFFSLIAVFFVALYFYNTTKTPSEKFETGEGVSLFGRLFGGGELVEQQVGTTTESIVTTEEVGGVTKILLRKISDSPVSGSFIFDTKDKKSVIRYVDRGTGHIYQTKADSNTVTRVSNTTIPRIQRALWLSEDSLIMQYLDDNIVKSFYADIVGFDNEKEGSIEAIFFEDDIEQITNIGNNQIFYLTKDKNNSYGTISKPNGDSKKQVFQSPLREWLVQSPAVGSIFLTNKPSYVSQGYTFSLSSASGDLTRVFGGLGGFTSLVSPDKTKMLVSYFLRNDLVFGISDVKKKEFDNFLIKTLPEKCVWGKDSIIVYCGAPLSLEKGLYPDDWYQGNVSSSDRILKINTNTGEATTIVFPEEFANEEIDLIEPSLSPDEKYLLFMNKKDSSLWVADVSEEEVVGE